MKNLSAKTPSPVTPASLEILGISEPASLEIDNLQDGPDEIPDSTPFFEAMGLEKTPAGYVSPDMSDPAVQEAPVAPKKPAKKTRVVKPKKEVHAPRVNIEPPLEGGYMPLGKTRGGTFVVWSNIVKGVYEFGTNDLMNKSKLLSVAGLHWLRYNHGGMLVRYDEAGDALQNACVRTGLYSRGKERGTGVWRQGDDLIVNGATCFWASNGDLAPRVHDDHIYLELDTLGVEPGQAELSAKDGLRLESAFNSYRWANGLTNARLMFGWTAVSPIAAALLHRPMTFVFSKEGGAGKSFFKKMQSLLLAERAMRLSAGTEAGFRQTVNGGALLADEMGKDSEARVQSVFELLKLANDGEKMPKGTEDHKGHTFDIRFAACLYGVNVPQMNDQVRGRFHVAELLPFETQKDDQGRPIESDLPVHELAPTPENEPVLAELGRQMFARMLKRWPEYQQSITHIRRAVTASSRFLDTFTPMIAACYTMTHDEPLTNLEDAQKYVSEYDLESEKDRVANVGRVGIEFQNAFDSINYDFGGAIGRNRLDIVIGHASYENQQGVLRKALRQVGIHVRARKGATLSADGMLEHEICIQCPISDAFRSLFRGGQYANGDLRALITSIPGASPQESPVNDVRFGMKPSKYLTIPFDQPVRADMQPLQGSNAPDPKPKVKAQDRSHLPVPRLLNLKQFFIEVEKGDRFAITEGTTSHETELMYVRKVDESDDAILFSPVDEKGIAVAQALFIEYDVCVGLRDACPEFWLYKPAPTQDERKAMVAAWDARHP